MELIDYFIRVFFISLVELDEFNRIKLSKIGRLDQELNPGHLHKSQAC